MTRAHPIARRSGPALVCAAALVAAGAALATPPLASVALSPDVTVDLAGTPFEDDDVAVDDLMGGVVPASLGSLPETAAVTAFHVLANGDRLFALDTTVELPGPLVVEQRDIVRFDGLTYTLAFDGSAAGVPDGAAIDAVSVTSLGPLLLSFETTLQLGAIVAADEDVVGWDGANFVLAFDVSAAGIPDALDTNGIHDLQDDRGALSFDASGSVAGIDFDDEDVLLFDFAASEWTLGYDGSTYHPSLAAADVQAIAVPEPRGVFMLAAGIAWLATFGRHRPGARQPGAEPHEMPASASTSAVCSPIFGGRR